MKFLMLLLAGTLAASPAAKSPRAMPKPYLPGSVVAIPIPTCWSADLMPSAQAPKLSGEWAQKQKGQAWNVPCVKKTDKMP